jgi:hypothetical protein
MRLPGWLAKLLARIFPCLEWTAALRCELCGREIELTQGMTEAEMNAVAEAHDRFFHSQ